MKGTMKNILIKILPVPVVAFYYFLKIRWIYYPYTKKHYGWKGKAPAWSDLKRKKL